MSSEIGEESAVASGSEEAPHALGRVREVCRPLRFCKQVAPWEKDILVPLYLQDVCQDLLVSGAVAPKPAVPSILRVCQWNINSFDGAGRAISRPRPRSVLAHALEFKADVLVLNEWDDTRKEEGKRILKEYGYSHQTKSDANFPTMIAVHDRCKSKKGALSLTLGIEDGEHRAAIKRCVKLPDSKATVAIYGTHLHHEGPDAIREREAQNLLAHIERHDASVPTLVVGDFNHPRRRDYALEEWDIIQARQVEGERSLVDEEGQVHGLFEASGFQCSLDHPQAQRNWPTDALPPSTHWTGMALDYSFARGLDLHGSYVAPTALSDHFPVISDWIAPSA